MYINTTVATTERAEFYVEKIWVDSEETNCFKKQVLARGANLVLTPVSLLTRAVDTILGVGAGMVAIVTGGNCAFSFTIRHLDSTKKIISGPYYNLLKTLNPEAEISRKRMGSITEYVSHTLRNAATSCYKSENFFLRHVVSRLTYALLAICSVITRIVDALIGLAAAALSFLTLGKVKAINNVAYRALQAPGIVQDFFYCTVKIINPGAK